MSAGAARGSLMSPRAWAMAAFIREVAPSAVFGSSAAASGSTLEGSFSSPRARAMTARVSGLFSEASRALMPARRAALGSLPMNAMSHASVFLRLPTVPEFPTLNVSHAVAITLAAACLAGHTTLRVGASTGIALGEPATLILLGDDYDGGHKAWIRWPDGRDDIVPGSQVKQS